MNMYRKFLFFISVTFLSAMYSSYAQSAGGVLLYSDKFESGPGNWSNVSVNDNKDWLLDSSGTPSSGTGPLSGADGSAYYMYLETSSGAAYTAGDTAILQGPSFTGTGIHLSFRYHMYGLDTGTLAVDVLSGGTWLYDVWFISGQQQISNSSPYAAVDIDLSGFSPTQIRLRATAKGGFQGDIAIDNIEIWDVAAGPVAPVFNSDPIVKPDARQDTPYFDALVNDASDANGDALVFKKLSGPDWLTVASNGQLSGTPLPTDVGLNSFVVEAFDGIFAVNATLNIQVNDNTAPILISNTDFESGSADWINTLNGDNKDWTLNTGGTPSVGTGPASGADSSKYYMYLETSSGSAYLSGDTAILQSPPVVSENIQLSFQYHMYGINTGTLAVDVLSNGVWVYDVWSLTGQQHTSEVSPYTAIDLDLSAYNVMRIRFRATAVGGYQGDIALDNIQIVSIPAIADEDADGVADSVDQCPNTPANETANANGCSPSQIDSDNDGVFDNTDAFPLDPTEWLDTDADGIGNNADSDDDGDGVLDINDAFPLDPAESIDTDGDLLGNNIDTDDDNDGVLDINDAYPLISLGGLTDTDADGIPNDCDASCIALGMLADSDDDNDGVSDALDAFPLNASESVDSDGDLIGNNADLDDDNDGVLDVNDAYPLISVSGYLDTDGDGIPDTCDASCIALGMVADSDDDNDGVADVADAFPLDASETLDTDGDLIGNNTDTDDDNDGVLDVNDAYPLISLSGLTDTDGDGIPNDCDASCVALGMTADSDDDNDGVADVVDAFPLDASETLDTDGDLIGNNTDTDDDNDGVLDINDAYPLISLSGLTDTDGDGIPNDCDASCIASGMIADSDDDNDSVSDVDEALNGTNPLLVDTDFDGWNDDTELACATDGNNILSMPLDTDVDQICNHLDIDADGDGLIEIHSLEMLNNMRFALDGSAYSDGTTFTTNGCGNGSVITVCNGYELGASVDFDENQNNLRDDLYNSGTGWAPLGSDAQPFTAIFDGNNFEIRNLYLTSDAGYAGFISVINSTTFKNVNFVNASINAGITDFAGIISGSIINSTVQSVRVSGEVIAPASAVVGGVTGHFSGTMNKVFAEVTIVGAGQSGGLTGINSGMLSEVYSSGSVTGNGDYLGGLTGINDTGATIEQCYSAASVLSSASYAGGLVGQNKGSVFNCFAEGNVEGVSYIGAAIGEINTLGEVRYNIATGIVTGSGEFIGGFTGYRVAGTEYPNRWDRGDLPVQYGVPVTYTTIELQTPTTNTGVYSSNFDGSIAWDITLWDFGTSKQYPGMIIDGIVYRDIDSDNDTVNDDVDAFPYDRTETVDTDGDGVGDNSDQCVSPVIPLTGDNDKDGCDDATNDLDDDNDGVPDTLDAFPLDATESADFDGDGLGDNADTDDDNDGFTDAQELHFSSNPYDALDKPKLVMTQLYTFEGVDVDGLYGSDVADVGDLNGDGYSEIIIGAYKVDNYRGRVQVYSGADGTLMYEILGDDQTDYFGFEVSAAGDVNADGFKDFIVARYRDSANNILSQAYSGEARVYSGVNGQVLYNLYGDAAANERDNFGSSASGAGDVNNDGFADIIVGATQDKNGGLYASGSAKVFSGQDGSVLYKFTADESGELFGQSVTAVGDINADGYDDVAVGATRANGTGNNRGRVRVFSGFDGSVIYDVYGDADSHELGNSIKSIGDVNNDTYPDLVVGVRYSDVNGESAGKAKIISGVDGAVLFEVLGATAYDYLGGSVSNVDDVNGDLVADVVIGSTGNDTTGISAGLAQIVSGLDGTPLFTLYGENAEDFFGHSVSGLADINGDGLGDLIVGASGYDGAGDKTGKVYVYVTDSDLDSDGVGSLKDAFPLDPAEWADSDGDGVGDNADAFPLDPLRS